MHLVVSVEETTETTNSSSTLSKDACQSNIVSGQCPSTKPTYHKCYKRRARANKTNLKMKSTITTVMLPCVMLFHVEGVYCRSAGRPKKVAKMLRSTHQEGTPSEDGEDNSVLTVSTEIRRRRVQAKGENVQQLWRRRRLTSAIPSARKLAPRIRSCATALSGSASRTARNTRDDKSPRRK